MIRLVLKIPRRVKLYEYSNDIALFLPGDKNFKIGIKCVEDVPGGRVFELTVVYDKFDEVKLYTFSSISGFVTYAVMEGQREFFEALKGIIRIHKYYVSPWNSIDVYVSDIEVTTLTDDVKELISIIKDKYLSLRSGRGWFNYFKYNPDSSFIEKTKNIQFTLTTLIE